VGRHTRRLKAPRSPDRGLVRRDPHPHFPRERACHRERSGARRHPSASVVSTRESTSYSRARLIAPARPPRERWLGRAGARARIDALTRTAARTARSTRSEPTARMFRGVLSPVPVRSRVSVSPSRTVAIRRDPSCLHRLGQASSTGIEPTRPRDEQRASAEARSERPRSCIRSKAVRGGVPLGDPARGAAGGPEGRTMSPATAHAGRSREAGRADRDRRRAGGEHERSPGRLKADRAAVRPLGDLAPAQALAALDRARTGTNSERRFRVDPAMRHPRVVLPTMIVAVACAAGAASAMAATWTNIPS
jgi:hypothetical protein